MNIHCLQILFYLFIFTFILLPVLLHMSSRPHPRCPSCVSYFHLSHTNTSLDNFTREVCDSFLQKFEPNKTNISWAKTGMSKAQKREANFKMKREVQYSEYKHKID